MSSHTTDKRTVALHEQPTLQLLKRFLSVYQEYRELHERIPKLELGSFARLKAVEELYTLVPIVKYLHQRLSWRGLEAVLPRGTYFTYPHNYHTPE